MERKDAVQHENALEPSIIRCYTDGSRFNGRVGVSFYIEHASESQTDQNFFHQQAEVAKELIMDRIVNKKIIIIVDSQAAILAIQNNIVKSNTVLTCIENLNILGKTMTSQLPGRRATLASKEMRKRISWLSQDQH